MSSPKVVCLDIETIPNLPEALKVWPSLSNYPGLTFKASINSIACVGYKIIGEEKTHMICAWDFPQWEVDVNDDRPLLRALTHVLQDTDAYITQNGRSFDEKFIQTRLLIHGMDILPPTKHVDTKLLAKKFSFFSNSLKYLAEQLTSTRKIENEGWALWCAVHARDKEACQTMANYCRGDVEALEAIWRRLRVASTGANSLPNHNLFLIGESGNTCPHCQSTRLMKFGIRYSTNTYYQRYKCKDCGAYSRTDAKDRNPRSL